MKNGTKLDHESQPVEFIRSSGNVFADLDLPEAPLALAKAQIVSRICDLIEERGLTQAEAGKILGLPQPKVSNLKRGLLDGFSTERLFRFLNALGEDVEIRIATRPEVESPATIRVVAG
jgi:predicted XRE-type DNA-binding protein